MRAFAFAFVPLAAMLIGCQTYVPTSETNAQAPNEMPVLNASSGPAPEFGPPTRQVSNR
jgi:hypothetical protein